jgi:hypothetical protein
MWNHLQTIVPNVLKAVFAFQKFDFLCGKNVECAFPDLTQNSLEEFYSKTADYLAESTNVIITGNLTNPVAKS